MEETLLYKWLDEIFCRKTEDGRKTGKGRRVRFGIHFWGRKVSMKGIRISEESKTNKGTHKPS